MGESSDDSGRAAGEADIDGRDRDELARALHDRLAATGELPVDRATGRWLGEAEAVAADLAGELPPAAAERRAAQVEQLLANVDETGSVDADAHVAAARRLAAAIRSRAREESTGG